mmetsp:Transcript_16864/g.41759  ORF Transcript_16864/g.41759 Transcript_16864/m.41759 type:complete len:240 (-) Transcript_16864:2599-3318(-)
MVPAPDAFPPVATLHDVPAFFPPPAAFLPPPLPRTASRDRASAAGSIRLLVSPPPAPPQTPVWLLFCWPPLPPFFAPTAAIRGRLRVGESPKRSASGQFPAFEMSASGTMVWYPTRQTGSSSSALQSGLAGAELLLVLLDVGLLVTAAVSVFAVVAPGLASALSPLLGAAPDAEASFFCSLLLFCAFVDGHCALRVRALAYGLGADVAVCSGGQVLSGVPCRLGGVSLLAEDQVAFLPC